jgi:aldose 1-epimerase
MGIEESTRDGYPALTLTSPDGGLKATFVPQLGMVGASLEHRGEELLGQRKGLAAYEASGSTMGIPLLHPWANRLSGLTYEAAGRHVTIDPDSPRVRLDPNGLPIHGLLAANHGWRTEQHDGHLTATLDFGAQPELLEAFPFPHELRMEIALDATRGLTVTTTISANQGSPVPVSFGFHPYLTLPNAPRADWHVELPAGDRIKTDERGIPTGATEPAREQPGPLGDRSYDDGYRDLPDRPAFVLADDRRRIELTFEHGYDFAQVYAPPGQDLICFEPMTAPTNALISGDGLAVVEDEFSATFRICVTES